MCYFLTTIQLNARFLFIVRSKYNPTDIICLLQQQLHQLGCDLAVFNKYTCTFLSPPTASAGSFFFFFFFFQERSRVLLERRWLRENYSHVRTTQSALKNYIQVKLCTWGRCSVVFRACLQGNSEPLDSAG